MKFSQILAAAFLVVCSAGSSSTVFAENALGISEVRMGILGHDLEVVEVITAPNRASWKEKAETGIDINAELLFQPISGTIGRYLYYPKPMLGGHVNTDGNTNFVYAALAWNHTFSSGIFIEGSFGFALHDGELRAPKNSSGAYYQDGRASLGSRILFRESIDVGYNITPTKRITAHFSHVSNGGMLSKVNEGMDFAGVRVTHLF